MTSANAVTIIYALGVLVIVLLGWIVVLELRLRKLMRGKTGESLEGIIRNIGRALDELTDRAIKTDGSLADVNKRLKRSIQGVKTVRFNPFEGTGQGGNQSFATAFINERGDGVVISGLYSRDHVRVFAKPVENHNSEHELSTEEKECLKQARLNN